MEAVVSFGTLVATVVAVLIIIIAAILIGYIAYDVIRTGRLEALVTEIRDILKSTTKTPGSQVVAKNQRQACIITDNEVSTDSVEFNIIKLEQQLQNAVEARNRASARMNEYAVKVRTYEGEIATIQATLHRFQKELTDRVNYMDGLVNTSK